ncbi:MAG: gamma-glutamyl-gamma-aminobutyrate hydrolase family protein [Anaerolineae bacterium]
MQPPQAPLIGIVADHKQIYPTSRSRSARTFVGVYETYVRSVTNAGALAVVVPIEQTPEALRAIFDRLDGVLLTGGGDLDPVAFSQAPHPTLADVKPERDRAELLMARLAVEHDVPILGICRGHQVLNVALGGDLIQDINSHIRTEIAHDNDLTLPLDLIAHPVTLQPGSRLSTILRATDLQVNSRHHQAVRTPGAGLVTVGQAPDGINEATEHPDRRFVVSVQWHPENLCNPASVPSDMTPLFNAFVQAAAARHHERSAAYRGQ